MESFKPVSVVITTYNRSEALLAVLDGLLRQTDRNFEVIVADDGSSDLHRSRIRNSSVGRSLQVCHVWHPDIGFTASRVRNRGAEMAGSDYLIFLDGDCIPDRDFIAQHKALSQTGFFVNGSRVLLSDQLTQKVVSGVERVDSRSLFYWIARYGLGDANKFLGLLRLPDWQLRTQHRFSWKGIRSCNMGVWKSDFERVDGFDESFVGWGHEDADFVQRLFHAGVNRKNGYCATEVFHLWHKEAKRNQVSRNAAVVAERTTSKIVRASEGYSTVRENDDLVIVRLR